MQFFPEILWCQQTQYRLEVTHLFCIERSYFKNYLMCKYFGFKLVDYLFSLNRENSSVLCIYIYIYLYRVSQEEGTKLRESVPYVKIYRYNPKHLYPKLNGYGDNGQRSLKI